MRYLLIALLLSPLALFAQRGNTFWSGEVRAGLNNNLNHRPTYHRISATQANGLGWRVGVTAVMGSRLRQSSLLLGVDVINDRVDLDDYTEGIVPPGLLSDPTMPLESTRFRSGTLSVNQQHLRGYIGHRISINRVKLEYGLFFSGFVGGAQRFSFTQTTTAWFDEVTGQIIPLPDPLVSQGVAEVPNAALRSSGYGGLLLGIGFAFTKEFGATLELEQGLRTTNTTRIDNRYKYQNVRLGFTLSYRFP